MNSNLTNSILIVDDQPVNIQLIGALLRPYYKLYIADDGFKAMQVAIDKLPDLILLDVMMPGKSGYEVIQELKTNSITANIPVIFLTARADSEDIVHGFTLGGVDYITKPFNQNEILARIKTHLDLKNYRDTINTQNDLLNKQNTELSEIKIQLEKKNNELEYAMKFMEQNFNELNMLYNKILISENTLEKSYEDMKKLNAEKDKFFSLVAHDLRNPFSGLLGITDLIYKEFDLFEKDELIEMIKSMYDSVRYVYKFMEDLLEWSRSQQGKINMNIENIDLYELVNNAMFTISSNANDKQIKILSEIPESTMMMCDRNMIATVIRNLITNAVKFSNKGGLISITTDNFEEGSDKFIRVCVTDQGVGMSKKVVDDLFNLNKSEISRLGTDNEKGSGLGLVICKDFICKHKGKIWAESEEGNGSKFYFALPL